MNRIGTILKFDHFQVQTGQSSGSLSFLGRSRMKGKAPLEKLEPGPPPSIPKRSVALSRQRYGPVEHGGSLDACLHKQVTSLTFHKLQMSPTIHAVLNSYPADSPIISTK